MRLNHMQVWKNVGVWTLFIGAGLLTYGFGLYQGSQFRMQRTMASLQKPVKVELPPMAQTPPTPPPSKPVEAKAKPVAATAPVKPASNTQKVPAAESSIAARANAATAALVAAEKAQAAEASKQKREVAKVPPKEEETEGSSEPTSETSDTPGNIEDPNTHSE